MAWVKNTIFAFYHCIYCMSRQLSLGNSRVNSVHRIHTGFPLLWGHKIQCISRLFPGKCNEIPG